MAIEWWPIGDVTPYANNPRKNDGAAVEKVVASVRAFGWRQPLVIDQHGVIVVGDTRLKAAQRLELSQVHVHIARDLSPAEARAYRIADNRTADEADWDFERLEAEVRALQADGDLSLDELATLTAFDVDEVAGWLHGGSGVLGGVDLDDAPPPPATPNTKLGDTYQLGSGSTLIAAEATGRSARLIELDPRYCDVIVARWEQATGLAATRESE